MSSYDRILGAGIESPTHTISQPVVPTAIDLRSLRGQKPGRVAQPAARGARGLLPSGGMISAVIANAKGQGNAREPGKAGQVIDTGLEKVRDYAFGDEPADPLIADQREAHRNATINAYTAAAEQTARQGSQRHGVAFPEGSKYNGAGETVTSTADTRWSGGPLGSYGGEPTGSPFGQTPGTFNGVGGAFSGVEQRA
jgi:hypothetical protein